MDLETAVEQRHIYYILIREINNRLGYTQIVLNGEPVIFTTVQQLNLKNHIIKDQKKFERNNI